MMQKTAITSRATGETRKAGCLSTACDDRRLCVRKIFEAPLSGIHVNRLLFLVLEVTTCSDEATLSEMNEATRNTAGVRSLMNAGL